MNRREFVAATAAVAGCHRSATIGHRSSVSPIGLQLYTVRSLMGRDFEGTLRAVAAAGYTEVEFAGYFNRTPEQVRAALGAAGLGAPSVHVDYGDLDRWEPTLERARAVGHEYVVLAWIDQRARGSLANWMRIAERMNAAAEQAARFGLQFAYHNHDYVFQLADGRVPYDVLLENTHPVQVQYQMDVYWTHRGGRDPVDYFRRYPGRFPSVHVKDVDAQGRMVDVGAGVIDWRGIFAHAGPAGIRHYFVEHDDPADPLASIAASYRYLRSL